MKPKNNTLKPKVVLGIAAHPDDLDFGASGTMAKYAQNGADIHYLIITDGSKGSEDLSLTCAQLVSIRQSEQRAALKAIGGKSVTFLDYPDGELEITMDVKKDVVKAIRRLKPDVVISMDPTMIYSPAMGFINHPDHRAAGHITLDAVYPLARDHLSFPELFESGLDPHKTATVLLVNFDNSNYYEDITQSFANKIAALKAHASQISDIASVETKVRGWAKKAGASAGHELAEQFVRIDIT